MTAEDKKPNGERTGSAVREICRCPMPTKPRRVCCSSTRFLNTCSSGRNTPSTQKSIRLGPASWADKTKKQWLDYHLKHGNAARLVVEAKKAGTSFSLDILKKKSRTVSLQSLLSHRDKSIREAVRQARNYSTTVGTTAFAVTNGTHWIASISFAHNVSLEKVNAVVFYGIQDIHDHLDLFVDILKSNRNFWDRACYRLAS